MNVNRIIILWIIIFSGVYSLDLVPVWLYWLLVAPVILFHAWYTSPRMGEHNEVSSGADTTMSDPDPPVPLGADEIVLDEEFEETIELDCGGYVHLEGWRERVVATDNIKAAQKHPGFESADEYERVRVEL
jgi:hypothetical protein